MVLEVAGSIPVAHPRKVKTLSGVRRLRVGVFLGFLSSETRVTPRLAKQWIEGTKVHDRRDFVRSTGDRSWDRIRMDAIWGDMSRQVPQTVSLHGFVVGELWELTLTDLDCQYSYVDRMPGAVVASEIAPSTPARLPSSGITT